jgi:hypothetical protein
MQMKLHNGRNIAVTGSRAASDHRSHPSSIGVRLAALTRILCVSRVAPVRISTALKTLFATKDFLLLGRFRLTLDFFVFFLRDLAMYFLLYISRPQLVLYVDQFGYALKRRKKRQQPRVGADRSTVEIVN